MKNIYVLPTDKSSRVSIKEDVLVLHRQQYRLGTQNIYITSNEGVKDGDKLLILRDGLLWGKKGEVCTFIKRQPSNYGFDKAVVLGSIPGHTHTAECDIEYAIDRGDVSKICLTTDTDLIEEGIQSIPNEFLEWFLENPSCEHVELKQEKLHPDEVMDDSYPKDFLDYQIVFPNGESLIDAANEYARYDNTNVISNLKDRGFWNIMCSLEKKDIVSRQYETNGGIPTFLGFKLTELGRSINV